LVAAVDSCNKAIELEAYFTTKAYSNRGNALQSLGQLTKAVESYNRAIEFQPDFAEAHWNLSLALLLLGDLRNE